MSAGVFDEVEWLWWVGIVEADGYHERRYAEMTAKRLSQDALPFGEVS